MKIGDELMWQYVVIVIVLLLIAFAILKAKNKDFKLEANKLIEYLGGSANIISYEVNNSRFVVTLHNIELVNKDAIQKMGAKGIVEIDNQLKIIFGDEAKQLKKNIDDLK
ncbi:MAG: PTS transporter subunit EIIB [Bacilli bacterium]|nr:PTS transporter subunit EIIB [Bacilli bacterium]